MTPDETPAAAADWRRAAVSRFARIAAAVATVPMSWVVVTFGQSGDWILAGAFTALFAVLVAAVLSSRLPLRLRTGYSLSALVIVGLAYLFLDGPTLGVGGLFTAATLGACLLTPHRVAWGLFLVTVVALLASGALADAASWYEALSGEPRDRYLELRMVVLFGLAVGGTVRVLDVAIGALEEALTREAALVAALRHEDAAHQEMEARLAGAEAEARRRLAQELHDDIGQQMTVLRMGLGMVPFDTDVDRARARLRATAARSRELAARVRELASASPPERLSGEGLGAALSTLYREGGHRAGLTVEVEAPPARLALDPDVEFALYRIGQEALNNALRHAGASTISLRLTADDEHVRLEVADDGRGFDVEEALGRSARGSTLGLGGIRTRAESLGGRVTLGSTPGGGSRLAVTLPAGRDPRAA